MTPDGKMEEIEKFNFSNHKQLETLAKYESAKKRNVDESPPHVNLMKKLAIADYEPASDSGNMRFYPNGRLIKSQLNSMLQIKFVITVALRLKHQLCMIHITQVWKVTLTDFLLDNTV